MKKGYDAVIIGAGGFSESGPKGDALLAETLAAAGYDTAAFITNGNVAIAATTSRPGILVRDIQ